MRVRPGRERRRPAEATVIAPLTSEKPESTAALPIARGLARIQGATLHLLLLGDPGLPVDTLAGELGLGPDELRDAIIDRAPGPLTPATLELARRWRGATIVLTLQKAPDGTHHALGPDATEILLRTVGPVVLVPPERGLEPWIVDGILVPHDGTPTTAAAIGPALDLAARASSNLVIVHVTEPGSRRPLEPGTMTAPRYIDQPQHEWPAWAREFTERLCAFAAWGPERSASFLATGDPGPEIARFSREAGIDLVVIGWRGSLEATRATTMKEVISQTEIPVLILRT